MSIDYQWSRSRSMKTARFHGELSNQIRAIQHDGGLLVSNKMYVTCPPNRTITKLVMKNIFGKSRCINRLSHKGSWLAHVALIIS